MGVVGRNEWSEFRQAHVQCVSPRPELVLLVLLVPAYKLLAAYILSNGVARFQRERRRKMHEKPSKQSHVSTAETLWQDIGFTPDEAAVLELKYTLHSEIEKEIKRQKLTPKQVGRVLDIQQPHVSDLLRGKISKMSTDRLTKYLRRLGRQVKVTTKKAAKLQGTEVA